MVYSALFCRLHALILPLPAFVHVSLLSTRLTDAATCPDSASRIFLDLSSPLAWLTALSPTSLRHYYDCTEYLVLRSAPRTALQDQVAGGASAD